MNQPDNHDLQFNEKIVSNWPSNKTQVSDATQTLCFINNNLTVHTVHIVKKYFIDNICLDTSPRISNFANLSREVHI